MSKLWIFGDSFAADDHLCEMPAMAEQWHRILGESLGLERVNMARSGSALDHMYCAWHSVSSAMGAGDLAVVVLTEPSRRWLLKTHPDYSTASLLFSGFYESLPQHLAVAMQSYFRYLDHPSTEAPHLYNWLCAADRVASRGVRVLVLSGFKTTADHLGSPQVAQEFPHLSVGVGCLLDVSMGECHEDVREKIMELEWRFNHMSLVNHRVLADKISEWYREGDHVDLTQGFHERIVDWSVVEKTPF